LLQKNYYLHRSANDGYRSYLQAYASYSLKSIFDVNKLDLIKVGKAFGFTVPPRVNISVGSAGGGSNASHSKKRRRTEMEGDDVEMQDARPDADEMGSRSRGNKDRRVEQMGHKKAEREIYKIAKDRQREREHARHGGDQRQWSR
jgi:ATP-dependent RNA helicase DDX18/HAS1